MFLAPTADGMPPVHKQRVPEHSQASRVTGYRVVVEVLSHDRFEPLIGLGQGIVHSRARCYGFVPLPHLSQYSLAKSRS